MKKLWEGWKKIGLAIGNFVSTVVLTIFYFTVFAVFAIPFRLFSRLGKEIVGDSSYSSPDRQMESLNSFKREF